MLKLVYFASLREQLGTDQESLALPEGVETVAQLTDYLIARGDGWQPLAAANLLVAVNQEMVDQDCVIQGDEEVAYFPPVTGG
ncbi:molybdopterin converting factor subunit 1 [Marinobacterium jannaschii]|uniref:molybdopterin converting factor subunit 1 n=1 Tax=Marinobacterium jannaschii TaxID=64970 RepID=UPI000486116A|nr:molybdopterin converting factor subunit 1 [Marinobacterium jannaschii]